MTAAHVDQDQRVRRLGVSSLSMKAPRGGVSGPPRADFDPSPLRLEQRATVPTVVLDPCTSCEGAEKTSTTTRPYTTPRPIRLAPLSRPFDPRLDMTVNAIWPGAFGGGYPNHSQISRPVLGSRAFGRGHSPARVRVFSGSVLVSPSQNGHALWPFWLKVKP